MPTTVPVFEVRADRVPGMLTEWFEVELDEIDHSRLFPDYDDSGGVRDIVARAVEHDVLVCSDPGLEVTCYAVCSDDAHLNLIAVRDREFRVHAQVSPPLTDTRHLVAPDVIDAVDTVASVLERVAAHANTVAPVAQRMVAEGAA